MDQRQKIIKQLIKEDMFFSIEKQLLTKHFLNHTLNINVLQSDIKKVKEEFCNKYEYKYESLPCDENEFYQFVSEEIIEIEKDKEPRNCFNEEILRVIKDLNTINQMLEGYEKQLLEQYPEKDRYIKYQYQYLVNKLQLAKDEIYNYMTNSIKEDVLEQISKKKGGIHFFAFQRGILRKPYNFRDNEEQYKISIFDGLAYKFRELPLNEFSMVKELYNNKKEEFYLYLDNYLKQNKIVEKILYLIDTHHLLNKKGIIREAIELYKLNKIDLFCQIIPLQIEGIIYDYCRELDIQPSEIDRVSLDKKVEALVKKDPDFEGYEYFQFNFIELRNLAAHGRVQNEMNYKDTANMLILDLYCLCDYVSNSYTSSINKIRDIFKIFEENRPIAQLTITFDYLAKYRMKDFPDFYNMEKTRGEMMKFAYSEKFYQYLESITISHNKFEDEKHIKGVLVYLKTTSKEHSDRYTELLKRLSKN
ncbi:hypothetical protein DX932_29660 [Bacillus cereus]|uniref:Uncharacterized protein n=1 Tax=Bacillus cereus TaxID=1396 RepID=A0A9W7PZP5_BACCE|nr:hypothetical protein [Bacillus cereus]KAA6449778.1 hypothetical protein DX932_29660 [Bacillus cereus]